MNWKLPSDCSRWSTEYVDISPAIAGLMLEHNRGNRPEQPAHIKALANKMSRGDWVVTHQGIAFSTSGRLIDGQHRLMAIVESGITAELSVTYGLPDNAFDHIDVGGRARTASDLLGIRAPHLKNRALMCATASTALRGMYGWNNRFRPDEVANYTAENAHLIQPFVDELKKGTAITSKSSIIGAFFAATRLDDGWPGPKGYRDREEVFFAAVRLAEQDWEGKGDPLKQLFNRLVRAATSSRNGTSLLPVEQYALAVSACRNAISNKKIGNLLPTEVDWGEKGDRGGTLVVSRRKVTNKRKK